MENINYSKEALTKLAIQSFEKIKDSDLKCNHSETSRTTGEIYKITKTNATMSNSRVAATCQSFYSNVFYNLSNEDKYIASIPICKAAKTSRRSGYSQFNCKYSEKYRTLMYPIIEELGGFLRFTTDSDDKKSIFKEIDPNINSTHKSFDSFINIKNSNFINQVFTTYNTTASRKNLALFSVVRTLYGADNVMVFPAMVYLYYIKGLSAIEAVSIAVCFIENRIHSRSGYKNLCGVRDVPIQYIKVPVNYFKKINNDKSKSFISGYDEYINSNFGGSEEYIANQFIKMFKFKKSPMVNSIKLLIRKLDYLISNNSEENENNSIPLKCKVSYKTLQRPLTDKDIINFISKFGSKLYGIKDDKGVLRNYKASNFKLEK